MRRGKSDGGENAAVIGHYARNRDSNKGIVSRQETLNMYFRVPDYGK